MALRVGMIIKACAIRAKRSSLPDPSFVDRRWVDLDSGFYVGLTESSDLDTFPVTQEVINRYQKQLNTVVLGVAVLAVEDPAEIELAKHAIQSINPNTEFDL